MLPQFCARENVTRNAIRKFLFLAGIWQKGVYDNATLQMMTADSISLWQNTWAIPIF